MSVNWDAALPQQKTFKKIETGEGVYPAYYVGVTEPWTDTGNCYECGGSGTKNGEPCPKKCENGRKTRTMIGLLYEMPDGTKEQEQVTFSISPPKQINGQTTRASTLYLRLRTFYGYDGPGDLGRCAKGDPNPRIPVTVIIKMNQTGKFAKVSDVLPRQDSTVAAIAAKAKQNAAVEPDQDEIPF